MKLERYSMGCGDRFGQEAEAQLAAFEKIADDGVKVVPVWNKSNREHDIIGTEPSSARKAAAAAVEKAGWSSSWYVDADHINLKSVDRYLDSSDFFTLDVADSIGGSCDEMEIKTFFSRHGDLIGRNLSVEGLTEPVFISRDKASEILRKYLPATRAAGEIYRKVLNALGEGNFIPEVSMDETDTPQGPEDLLLILAAVADEGIPVQTIAPRFSGRFNKGVEYVGNPAEFAVEFESDILMIRYAVSAFGLPDNLKLSVHSGSDKFAIYPEISRLTAKHGAGVHVKTAGTTWLEEVIGLADADGGGLALAKEVYASAFDRRKALCAPYAEVIDIADSRLPSVQEVQSWDSGTFVRALRHDASDNLYNPDFRQLIHVGYKVAAEMGSRYIDALAEYRSAVAANVTGNLYERHLKRLFRP